MTPNNLHTRRESDHGMTEHQQLEAKIDEVNQRLATIESLVKNQAVMCPYRELLARAANNIDSMAKMKTTVTNLRLEVVKYGVLAGLASTVIVAAIMAFLDL